MSTELKLNQLASFVAVVETGSFTRGAQRTGQSKALVSLHVSELESMLGAALLVRTTRKLALTEIGERFFCDSRDILGATQAAIDSARQGQQTLRGTLRVSASAGYGLQEVVPSLVKFARLHPELVIEYLVADQFLDLVGEGVDLAIRISPGLNDNSYRARKIGDYDMAIVGAPTLLANKWPESLADLATLPWVIRQPGTDAAITLQDAQQVSYQLQPSGTIRANQFQAMLAFVEAGLGLGIMPLPLLQDALQAGRLQRVLPQYTLPRYEVFAVYPNTPYLPGKVRALLDFLIEEARSQANG